MDLLITQDPEWIQKALELRARVFGSAYGIDASTDHDQWDDHCWHFLAIKDHNVVGCYRAIADSSLGFYSESEFDLSNLGIDRSKLLEVGRAAVAPEVKNAMVITRLWSSLIEFAEDHGYTHIFGPSSISLDLGRENVAGLALQWRDTYQYQHKHHAVPLTPLNLTMVNSAVEEPGLIKLYLKLGAEVVSDPCVDYVYNTADFITMLDINNIDSRWFGRLGK